MSNIEANYIRYALVFTAASLIVPLVPYLIAAAGIDLYSSFFGIIPVLIAAMVEGDRYAAEKNERPTSNKAWRFALKATLICVIVSLVMTLINYGYIFYVYELSLDNMDTIIELLTIALTMLIVTTIVSYFCNRIFYAMAAGNRIKALEKSK